MVWLWGVLACAGPPEGVDGPVAKVPSGFWDHWGDGRAELSAYALTTPRYGELRRGEAVHIWVTETFTHGQRVKSDGGHPDEYPVIKLNDSREFQTGIYDYDVMTSVFSRLDGGAPLGEPVKVSMSMAEWCGHVYEQLMPTDAGLVWHAHSYFDGEADRQTPLPRHRDGLVGDAAPLVARGLAGPWVGPGEQAKVDWLPTLVHGRVAHVAPTWGEATLSRSASVETVQVPAGSYEVRRFTVTAPEHRTTWFVEEAPPHRIVRWERSDGEVAELTGSQRVPYWTKNAEGDEALLAPLGLTP
jgi:hypothetical protein